MELIYLSTNVHVISWNEPSVRRGPKRAAVPKSWYCYEMLLAIAEVAVCCRISANFERQDQPLIIALEEGSEMNGELPIEVVI